LAPNGYHASFRRAETSSGPATLRFILKTSLAGLTPLRLADRPVLDDYAALQRRLGEVDGALFAEPVVTWGNGEAPGSISWYGEPAGDARPLRTLPPEHRGAPEAALAASLARLLPLREDRKIGPLITRALSLADADSVLAIGNRVVLVGWGLVPAGAPVDAASLNARLRETFGHDALAGPKSNLPSLEDLPTLLAPPRASSAPPPPPPAASPAPTPPNSPPISPGARPVPPAASRTPPPSSGLPPGAPPPMPPEPPPAAPDAPGPGWRRWLIPAGIAIAAVFLALGVWIGAREIERQYAGRTSIVHIADTPAMRDAATRREAENTALEAQIAAARRALEGNVCVADPAQMPSLGPPRDAPIVPAMRPPAPPGAGPFQGTLVELLRQATVLILVPLDDGLGIGTGFFVSPGIVVTARHVIEKATARGIFVVNTRLGRPLRASVTAQTPDSEIYKADIAVLQVPGAPGIQPLSLSRKIEQLDQVIAAGFPGLLMHADDAFQKLMDGDAASMPSLILTDGRINAVQRAPTGLSILPHSAQIAEGNSGGPLVDACGRVVGMNTFIDVSREQAVHINYAQKADTLLDFLNANGITATEQSDVCQAAAPQNPAPVTPVATAPPPPTLPAPPMTSPEPASPAQPIPSPQRDNNGSQPPPAPFGFAPPTPAR